MRQNPLSYLDAELTALREQGLFRQLRILDSEQKAHASFDHASVVNLSSNNYLGLTTHPRLRQRAEQALRELGVGSGSVRTIAGTMAIHMELERRLAIFKKTEAAVVFQSGFTANAGTVSSILGRDDVIVSDELNHASIIDGARLSRATIKVFPHRDTDAARAILKELPASQRKLLITDGVFSMDGDLAPLPALCELAEEFGCVMMVDDAHASGVFGTNGRGTVDHFEMHGRVDVQVGTLSKAIGALGGYVAGTKSLIEFLYHRARPFLFSTSHPPSVTATCIAALDVLESEPELDGTAVGQHSFVQGRAAGTGVRYRHRAKVRLPPSSSATARWRCGCPTGCSPREFLPRESPSRPSPGTGRGCARLLLRPTPGGVTVRPRRLCAGRPRAGNHRLIPVHSAQQESGSGNHEPAIGQSAISNVDPSSSAAGRRQVLRVLHSGTDVARYRAALHARYAGGLPVLLAQYRSPGPEEAAVAPTDTGARPAVLPGRSRCG